MTGIGIAVLAYLIVFLAVAMVWRSYRVWRKTGINPYRLGASASAHDYIGRWYSVVTAGVGVVAALAAFWPDGYAALEFAAWPRHGTTTLAGFSLMTIALAWVVIAQVQMGNSWRIGIDRANATDLVHTGLFRISRNPIFLGMRASLFGILLVLPNAATLALALLGEVLLQIQVRMEEEHLTRLHGPAYEAYCASTPRWI